MSPLWRDEIGIDLAPRRVGMVRLQRGIRPAVVAEREQTVGSKIALHWAGSLATVDTLLGQSDWQGAALHVVVADCWARYAIVPWVADLTSADERLGHARQLLASTYGDAVSGWDVRLSDTPPGSVRIACTMPVELLEGVRAICTAHDAKLASLRPQLVAAYENWRHRLPPSGAWFVTVSEDTLAAVRVTQRAWDRVHNVRIGSDWTRELKRLQMFGRLATMSPNEGQVYVDAPDAWRVVAGPAGQNVHWLEDDADSLTTLRQLGRLRRLAA